MGYPESSIWALRLGNRASIESLAESLWELVICLDE
jgi:hypothetical protein